MVDFDDQAVFRHAVGLQQVAQPDRLAFIEQGDVGLVDEQLDLVAGGGAFADGGHRFGHRPAVERDDQIAFLGDVDELGGRHDGAVAVGQAQQGLELLFRAAGHGHDRLVQMRQAAVAVGVGQQRDDGFRLDLRIAGQKNGAVHCVFKLAHIAAPQMGLKSSKRTIG